LGREATWLTTGSIRRRTASGSDWPPAQLAPALEPAQSWREPAVWSGGLDGELSSMGSGTWIADGLVLDL
jgi:hypothetical protein